MREYQLILGDCLEKLKDIPENSIDSIVTDSPYGISFMGQKWDYDVPSVDIWKECLRVLKPGGHLLSFAGSRTYHRMAVNIEDAGFEIRDQIMWVYGSGFPKSHNIGKAIDKKLGNDREVVEIKQNSFGKTPNGGPDWTQRITGEKQSKHLFNKTKGSSEWEGWGTALKPAHEPIVMARKPFKGTVADNVLEYGTGALNIDGCRVELSGDENMEAKQTSSKSTFSANANDWTTSTYKETGRWPANFIHNNLEEEWSKYFYCPKANKKDRNEGCEELEKKPAGCMVGNNILARPNHKGLNDGKFVSANNHHPTVKPTDLMRYLCRLVTPKNGTVLDPFCGSGSTGKAAVLEGFDFIGIELSEEYLNIAELRINHAITKDE